MIRYKYVKKVPKDAVQVSLGVYQNDNYTYEFGANCLGIMGYYRYKRINYLHYE